MLERLFKRDQLTNIYQKKNTVKVVVLLVATAIAAVVHHIHQRTGRQAKSTRTKLREALRRSD